MVGSRIKPRWWPVRGADPSSGRSLEAQSGQGGPPGEEPPEVDEEQAHAGDDGFLFAHRAAVGVADHGAPFGKGVPARFPADEPPDSFGEQAAQAPVALPVDGAQELAIAAGAALARGAANKAADLFAIAEALLCP